MTIVNYNLSDNYLREFQYKENHPYTDTTKLQGLKIQYVMDTSFDYLCKRQSMGLKPDCSY